MIDPKGISWNICPRQTSTEELSAPADASSHCGWPSRYDSQVTFALGLAAGRQSPLHTEQGEKMGLQVISSSPSPLPALQRG